MAQLPLMTEADYKRLIHFKMSEFKNPLNLRQDLVYSLDWMRQWMGMPFVIHEDFATTGHAPNSYHYQGAAVDGHFVYDKSKFSFSDIAGKVLNIRYELANKSIIFLFFGVGIYPHWNNPGFHLDIRPPKDGFRPTVWVSSAQNVYHYF
jgi:hypothetical protein